MQEYADMLNKSPKTLANILSAYQQPSAIRIIHNRIQAEARRLLLYTAKSSKEIALMLGFEDQAAFSRFFKNAAGLSATEYRHQYKNDNSGDDGLVACPGCSIRLLPVFATTRQLVVDGLIRFISIRVVPRFGNSFANSVHRCFGRIVL